jgi:CDP-glycerol glycerophosphotransferase
VTSAFFEAWRGRHADSPRAISDALRHRDAGVRQFWVTDGSGGPVGGATMLRRHRAGYFARLLTSDLIFSNDIISKHLVKGRGTYVQCWHGMPLKAIGHDEVDSKYDDVAHLKRMERDVKKWDFLVSSSPECTTIFRRAFGFEGTVLETGLPRNDVLSRDPDNAIRNRVRSQLGLTPEALVALYAPTWRDDSRGADGRFVQPDPPHFERIARATGVVFLHRLHKNVARSEQPLLGGVNVSAYPDIADLYLAADLLISDYSSAIFDFAITAKPIILHVPDLEHYRNDLRPLYFTYEDWAPGPMTMTDDDLVDHLRAARQITEHYGERLQRFRQRFCPFDDGFASDRVLDAALSRAV